MVDRNLAERLADHEDDGDAPAAGTPMDEQRGLGPMPDALRSQIGAFGGA